MKSVLMAIVAVATLSYGFGCVPAKLGRNEFLDTPAYSANERGNMIERNWDYEGKQMQDDIDHALLLRPASHMTIWNLR